MLLLLEQNIFSLEANSEVNHHAYIHTLQETRLIRRKKLSTTIDKTALIQCNPTEMDLDHHYTRSHWICISR